MSRASKYRLAPRALRNAARCGDMYGSCRIGGLHVSNAKPVMLRLSRRSGLERGKLPPPTKETCAGEGASLLLQRGGELGIDYPVRR